MSFETLDPKDPDDTEPFAWDMTELCAQLETTLTGATVVEVDALGNPIASPTLSIATPFTTPEGIVTVLVSGGNVGTSAFIRCRYTLANGTTKDKTIKVRISHQ
jgi:hypothetical protein